MSTAFRLGRRSYGTGSLRLGQTVFVGAEVWGVAGERQRNPLPVLPRERPVKLERACLVIAGHHSRGLCLSCNADKVALLALDP
jgi:hypothetical protein